MRVIPPSELIINADGSDEEVLLEEGLETTDAFLALTGLDEENLILSLYAKNIYHKKGLCYRKDIKQS